MGYDHLAKGEVVLCKSFTLSSMAYAQLKGHDWFREDLNVLEARARKVKGVEVEPDLTVFVDVTPETAASELGRSLSPHFTPADLVKQRQILVEEMAKLPPRPSSPSPDPAPPRRSCRRPWPPSRPCSEFRGRLAPAPLAEPIGAPPPKKKPLRGPGLAPGYRGRLAPGPGCRGRAQPSCQEPLRRPPGPAQVGRGGRGSARARRTGASSRPARTASLPTWTQASQAGISRTRTGYSGKSPRSV